MLCSGATHSACNKSCYGVAKCHKTHKSECCEWTRQTYRINVVGIFAASQIADDILALAGRESTQDRQHLVDIGGAREERFLAYEDIY